MNSGSGNSSGKFKADALRVGMFDPRGGYFANPSLRCIVEELQRNKTPMEIYLQFPRKSLREYAFAPCFRFPTRFRLWTGDVASSVLGWMRFCQYRSWEGHWRLRKKRYDIVYGVNDLGVIAAYENWRRSGTPYVYLSFELTFRDELSSQGRLRLKREEMEASRHAGLVVIQDECRARLLCEENGLGMDKMAFLPVAPRGPCASAKSSYLREKLHLASEQKSVLLSGSFMTWTCSSEILASLRCWPENYVLVVNTYYRQRTTDKDLNALRILSRTKKNVRIVDEPLGKAELDELMRSADVGLACYRATYSSPLQGKNIATMGLSSGKLATYLKNGLPVICHGNPYVKSRMEQYRFGEYLEDFKALPDLITKVLQKRDEYAKEGRRFFEAHLDFDRFWPPIQERVAALTRKY